MPERAVYEITCSRCGEHQRPESLGLYCDGADTRPPRPGEPAAANCGGLIQLRRTLVTHQEVVGVDVLTSSGGEADVWIPAPEEDREI